jgi:hypothetical protein
MALIRGQDVLDGRGALGGRARHTFVWLLAGTDAGRLPEYERGSKHGPTHSPERERRGGVESTASRVDDTIGHHGWLLLVRATFESFESDCQATKPPARSEREQ